MNKTTNGIIAVLVIAGIGYFAYMKLYGRKHKFAKKIIDAGNYSSSGMAVLHTFDEGFLKEWAKASKKATPTFSYQNKIYNTKGGTAGK